MKTRLSAHEEVIAGDESAVRILTRDYDDELRELISLTLENETRREYAFSLAREVPLPESDFKTGGPTAGNRDGQVSVNAPAQIIDESLPDDVSPEPTHLQTYADLILTHTHFRHSGPTVGLSENDLRDKIPGGDDLTGPQTPYDVYRAQSAIVFTNDETRLPATTDDWHTDNYVFTDRPETRPWLHLIERTPAATNLEEHEANCLHYDTLEAQPTGSEQEKYNSLREVLGKTVSEVLVPLSP